MRNNTRLKVIFIILCLFLTGSLFAQDNTPSMTASKFFDSISDQYGSIEDYQADIAIVLEDQAMAGTVYYKTPNLLRINFTDPEEQVIVVDGSDLMMYLPRQTVTMTQSLTRHNEASLTTMVAGQGLTLLSQGYSISYLDSPGYVPLEEESAEMVIKLRLEWRSTSEGFRQIIVSIGENGFIRRMEAVTKEYQALQYDLTNIMVNQSIPASRFDFDPPPSSYSINNFLFEPEE